jgi:GNAT superfamily N-acetyltransferase
LRLTAPEAINIGHDLSQFDSGVPVLDDWLRQRALRNESRFSRTYVVCEGARVAGFYCISAGSVERARVPGKLRRNAPESVPVAVIGRLAVDRGYAGRGLGADLLADALRRIAGAASVIGIAAVLVQAKDETAKAWYLRQAEFMAFPEDGRVLWLPVEMVVGVIAHPTVC